MSGILFPNFVRSATVIMESALKATHLATEWIEHHFTCAAAIGLVVAAPHLALLAPLTIALGFDLRNWLDHNKEMGTTFAAYKLFAIGLHAVGLATGWMVLFQPICAPCAIWLELWRDPCLARPVIVLVACSEMLEVRSILRGWLMKGWVFVGQLSI